MLENDRFHELKFMFDLFKLRAESLKFFQKKIFDYIIDRGEKIVDEKQSEETRIINLIKFRAKLYKFLHDSFNRDYSMEGTLTKSFDEFISKSSTTTKDLNKYIDKMFHNEFKNISQDDMEQKVQEAIGIFSHILDKDFFESLYRTSLAKRLMNTESKGASILQDAEKEMIKYLKKDIGASYTQRLEVMLADVESSIDQMTNFKDSALVKSIKCEFQAKVLTAGSWPRFNRDEAAKSSSQSIPPEI